MLLREPLLTQIARWPARGRHILAQFDADTVVVYQAYSPAIARWALDHGTFGGSAFSFTRMSWVKPNFLWMMYRSGWGTKEGQEMVLAVRIRRAAFDTMLARAVHSSHVEAVYGPRAAWEAAVRGSDVRLQWDPDHDASGAPVERRAVQLGLRGETLRAYANDWIVSIEDAMPLVAAQREKVHAWRDGALETPREEVYPVADAEVRARLGVD